jgi:hypothetical protein
MASIVINGDTSGSVTLQAPATAGATVLTLPTTSGTIVTTSGAQTIEFADGSASAPSITNSGDTNTGMFFPAADTIAFAEGGTEAMRIDSSGNVGIGTTSPATNTRLTLEDVYSAKLVLRGGSTQNGMLLNAVSTSNQYYIGAGNNLLNSGDKGILIYDVTNARAKFFVEDVNGETRTLATTFLSYYTGASERMRIDSSGNLLFNSGYGSVATAYGCRAWVNFNGTGTVAIRASGNVSSITDNGTGNYVVNLTNAMPDANYSVTAGIQGVSGSVVGHDAIFGFPPNNFETPTTSSFRLSTWSFAGSSTDFPYVLVHVIR